MPSQSGSSVGTKNAGRRLFSLITVHDVDGSASSFHVSTCDEVTGTSWIVTSVDALGDTVTGSSTTAAATGWSPASYATAASVSVAVCGDSSWNRAMPP